MIGGDVLIGLTGNGFGINYTGFRYNPTKKIFAGITFGYEQLTVSQLSQDTKINWPFQSGQIGITVLPKISPQCFVKLGAQIQVGKQQLNESTYVQSYNFILNSTNESGLFFGGGLWQGITFIPINKFGFSLGASIYQRIYMFEYYLLDFGVQLSFALKF
jgi:hypothetical protein